jgi:hypothetical protein
MSADSNLNRAALTPRPPGGRTGRTGKGLGPVTHGDVYVSRGWRGRGVFAARPFGEGEIVERCPTISVPVGEVSGLLKNYVFQAREHGYVLVVLGYGMLYNHSARPNLKWDWSERTIVTFTSKRAIKQGEELTHNYTRHWWAMRNRHPR